MTDVQTTGAELRTEEPDRPATASTRRLILLGAGAAGATAVLTACGTGSSGGNSSGSDFSDNPAPAGSVGTGDGGSAAPGAVLAAVADVPEGGGVIVCPCHGSKYSIETGEPTNGPATKPLAETPVRVDGSNVVVA